MKIGINASFLRKPDSGIGQVTDNFLRKLIELRDRKEELRSIEFVIYLEEEIDWKAPEGFEKKVLKTLLYQRDDLVRKLIWEKYLLPRAVKKDGCEKLISLYQSATVITDGRIRHLMVVHDTVWKIFPQYLSNLRKKIYYHQVDRAIPSADHLITISENSKEDIARFFSVSRDRVTTATIDCDSSFRSSGDAEADKKVLEKHQLDPGERYIFYVGGFDARKNVERLIHGYGRFYDRMVERDPGQEDNIPALVVAGNFHPQLVPLIVDLPQVAKEAADRYQIDERKIRRIGFVSGEDLPALYRGALLFCYPSLYEGFGLPLLEAQNCSVPILAADRSCIPEVVGDGALLINPLDEEEIADGMERLTLDESLRKELAEKGRRNASRFSWKIFVEKAMEKAMVGSL